MPRSLRCLVLLFAACAVQAQPAVPTLTGRVVDTAGILSSATEEQLTAQLAAAESSTGAQVVVLTVPALERESIEELAVRAFNAWGLGDAARDDGVLLLVARDDRELRIEVGYGLEDTITDSQAGRIIRDAIVPRFRDGDFDGGVSEGITAIVGTLDGTYVPPSHSPSQPGSPGILYVICILLVSCLLMLMGTKAMPERERTRYLYIGVTLVPLFGSMQVIPYGIEAAAVYAALWFIVDAWATFTAAGRAWRERKAAEAERERRLWERYGNGLAGEVDRSRWGYDDGGGGGSGGGGGFSGGGGSSGGGGASGSW